uniref:Fanconi anemia group M protein n=1 Tax=Anopheles epiroticus TaxID=199890 RepID=A0A182PI13_9DIPT
MDDSVEDAENRSDVLNQSTYSLADASFSRNDSFQLNLRRNASDCDGFDSSTGDSWIYPVDVPVRPYQYTITEAALFKNTLVVLPTGLGKTFIAAVVMYNIYRWYPTGKVIFMAPTRPLVSQQIEACARIVGIPRSDTAEVTGKQPRYKRASLWQTKRVFYATPQVVLADLDGVTTGTAVFPAKEVRLVVIDEAHKAKGRYAYTDVIRQLVEVNTSFRVLALSATPGRTLEDVAEVIKNLLISHIEVRYDSSQDLQPYVFRRDVRTIVIPLGQTIARIRQEMLRLVNPYLQRLLEANVFARYPDRLTHGALVMELKRFRNNALHQRHPSHSTIVSDFYACIGMYHAMELLIKHGIRAFLNYLLNGPSGGDGGSGTNNAQEKYFIAKDRQIKAFLDRLKEQFPQHLLQKGHGADDMTGNDDVDFGHPKFRILQKQLIAFFSEHPDSRAIVFCEFRDSVATIKRLLSDNQPAIRANCIVGQGSANGVRVPQQEQIDVIRQFRKGTVNTLIATCVAEEGIDVGEVDLIVCFDIAKNPTRFVQRIGRTGRQRVGRVLMLVTEGEEYETLKQVLASKDKTNQQLARSKDILRVLYRSSPRLLPPGVEPKCMKVNMASKAKVATDCSDSSDGECSVVGSGNRRTVRKRSKRLNDTAEDTPQPKRNKSNSTTHYSVRHYFQPRGPNASGELDAGEREIFSVSSPKENLHDRSRDSNTASATLSYGAKQTQPTIPALLQRLVQHYKRLSRQKFLCGQELLTIPTMEPKLGERGKLPLRRDNPLELPELIPHERCRPEDRSVVVDEGIDKSISNLFETTVMSESAAILDSVAEQIQRKAPPVSITKKTHPSTVKRGRKQQNVMPLDPCNSPLLLAFNRSVQKKKNSDTLETPVRVSVEKSQIGEEQRNRMTRQMVLEYFKLKDIPDIFGDDDADSTKTDTVCIPVVDREESDKTALKGSSINRRLFGETVAESNCLITVPNETVTHAADVIATIDKRSKTSDITLHPLYEPKTPEPRRLEIGSKCFDLGSVDLVFQDESDTECVVHASSRSMAPSSGIMLSPPPRHPLDVKLPTTCLNVHRSPSIIEKVKRSKTDRFALVLNEFHYDSQKLDDSVIGIKPRLSNRNRIESSPESVEDVTMMGQKMLGKQSETSMEQTPVRQSAVSRFSKPAKYRRAVGGARAFFQTQAAVSDDEGSDREDDDDGHGDVGSLASFVTSSDEESPNRTDMRAVYLQSVRSPVTHRGAFKIPSNCYRAPVPCESYLDTTGGHSGEEDYYDEMDDGSQLLGSFIDDNVLQASQSMELCELERAEMLIEERRRRDRRARQQSISVAGEQKKRRRVKVLDTSDTD